MIIHRLQYAHGVVASIDTLKTFEVQFDDGTLCSEMSIKDIIVSVQCINLHVHVYGIRVHVQTNIVVENSNKMLRISLPSF